LGSPTKFAEIEDEFGPGAAAAGLSVVKKKRKPGLRYPALGLKQFALSLARFCVSGNRSLLQRYI
jgi:hypothetical protein